MTVTATRSRRFVVMGVSGSGKTTIGRAAAARLGVRFVDADEAHPIANIAKMAAGVPLTDHDRRPWLERLATVLAGGEVLVTCSALTRPARDRLRATGPNVRFVLLSVDEPTARTRMEERVGHFMGPHMVVGQFAAFEPPEPDEGDIVVVDATTHIDAVVEGTVAAFASVG